MCENAKFYTTKWKHWKEGPITHSVDENMKWNNYFTPMNIILMRVKKMIKYLLSYVSRASSWWVLGSFRIRRLKHFYWRLRNVCMSKIILWKLINEGVQNKVRGCVNISEKLINVPPLLIWTQEYTNRTTDLFAVIWTQSLKHT